MSAEAESLRILVVEDSPVQAAALVDFLREQGHEVDLATDAEQVLAALPEWRWRLVICDVGLPGTSGYEVCRRIKEEATDAPVGVVLMTIHDEVREVLRGLESGADAFLSKPFDPDQLLETLPRVLENPITGVHRDAEVLAFRYQGQDFEIRSSRERILQYLISTFQSHLHSLELLEESRLHADQERRRAEQLQGLNAQMPALLFTADRKLRLTTISGRALDATTHIAEELSGKTLAEVFPAGGGGGDLTRLARKVIDGTPGRIQVEWRDFQLHLSLEPYRDEGGAIVGVLGLGVDVSLLRELESELVISDRQASIGRLASGVAHEINNPLTFLLNNLESTYADVSRLLDGVGRLRRLVEEESGFGAVEESLGEASEVVDEAFVGDLVRRLRESLGGARRVETIVRTLGTFSRREDTEDRVPLDLNRVVELAMQLTESELKYRARLTVEAGSIPPVLGSKQRLSQMILNLLLNAAQSIEEGHTERNQIEVITYLSAGTVVLEIRDTGRGIAPDDLKCILDPFFTTGRESGRSGLGLYVSRNIARSLGGDLEIESVPGEGTTVRIRLPATSEGLPPESHRRPPSSPTTPAQAPGRSGRILVVDDEPLIGALCKRALGRRHEVVVAGSGKQARSILEGDANFDAILCDVMMPDLNGVELYEWIRERRPQLAERVLFASGGGFTHRIRDFLDSVPNQMLEKPFRVESLRQVVEDFLAARAST